MFMLIVFVSTYIIQVSGYATGAPAGTCLTMYPHHGVNLHQSTNSPFKIRLNKATYKPSDELTAVIKADDDAEFKGIEMRVHRASGNMEALLGEFNDFPTEKLQTRNCFSGLKNLITHKNNETVISLEIKWRAPDENVGDIQFTATIVQNYTTYWFNVKTIVQVESDSTIVAADFQMPSYDNSSFGPISLSPCGQSKGCFLHPPACNGANCKAAVTYKQNPDTTYTFEVFGASAGGAGWIGVGISKDKLMGDDQVFMCSVVADRVIVLSSFNPSKYTVQEYTKGFSAVHTSLADGQISCRFTRPNLTRIDHNGVTFDLSDARHVLLSWGSTYGDTGQAKKHVEEPVVSYKMVQFNDKSVHTTDKLTVTSGANHVFSLGFGFIFILILCSSNH